jgi:hypothetical protein
MVNDEQALAQPEFKAIYNRTGYFHSLSSIGRAASQLPNEDVPQAVNGTLATEAAAWRKVAGSSPAEPSRRGT